MIILGVTNTGDSGAALIVDGKIVAAANEERFVRKGSAAPTRPSVGELRSPKLPRPNINALVTRRRTATIQRQRCSLEVGNL